LPIGNGGRATDDAARLEIGERLVHRAIRRRTCLGHRCGMDVLNRQYALARILSEGDDDEQHSDRLRAVRHFAGKVMGDLAGVSASLLAIIGDRLVLFWALDEGGPATSAELAERAGVAGIAHVKQASRRWMYSGKHPNRRAVFLNRSTAAVAAAGIGPRAHREARGPWASYRPASSVSRGDRGLRGPAVSRGDAR